MSRKNLSRTVIEGGRYRYNKYQRRSSHGSERATTRTWLDHVMVDAEYADFTALPPLRPVGRSFYDKLAPAKRWLASNVGRPWNKVYQELCTTFSRKTIAGNHVVEHMLDWVQTGPVKRHGEEFVVDRHGILRRGPLYGRSYSRLRKEALAWAQNRRIARTRSGLWWFQIRGLGAACTTYPCSAKHVYLPETYDSHHEITSIAIRALTAHELRRFELIPTDIRSQIMI